MICRSSFLPVLRLQNPDYVTSWLTHGMLEAAAASTSPTVLEPETARTALELLRSHMNWFNGASETALFLPPSPGGPNRDCFAPSESGHEVYLIYQVASCTMHSWLLLCVPVVARGCCCFSLDTVGSINRDRCPL
jgi:hypothetical protein